MSLAADALQPQLVRELISLSGRANFYHLADVITDAPRAGFDLDFDPTESAIRIDFRDRNCVAAAVAGDATRFASACFTSLAGIAAALEQASTLPWGLVRLYYAGFYAGHCIIRLLGQSCSMIEARHMSKLRALASALGTTPAFDLNSGLYHCTVNAGQTGFSMVYSRGRLSGSHEIFWDIFDRFLSNATEEVLLGHLSPPDARSVFAKLEAVRQIFRRGVGASWLSQVRNEIQYRHLRGVWIPSSVNKTQRSALSRLAAQWARDPMDIDLETPPAGDLGAFIVACAFNAALCRSLLERIAERYQRAPAASRGPHFSFVNGYLSYYIASAGGAQQKASVSISAISARI